MGRVNQDFTQLDPKDVPLTLARLHGDLETDAEVVVRLPVGVEIAEQLVEGAGFETVAAAKGTALRLRRLHSLPDIVGPEMRLLICGLNPSPASSEQGIGFARPGNRFWPAALAAGIVSRDRDPEHGLQHHRIGMSDLVKRTTRRANELAASEYGHGLKRVDHLAQWLSPRAICFVGLAGWRMAVDRKAMAGVQPATLGGRPVYLMPSTSGLNAHSQIRDLTIHFQEAASLADVSA